MGWKKRVGSFLGFLPVIGVAIVFVVLAIIAQSYRDNFCMRDPARNDAYAQRNAKEVERIVTSLSTALAKARTGSSVRDVALAWKRLDDITALTQTPGVFQSPMRDAVWWNPLSWVYLGPKIARYTPQECAQLAEKIAEAQAFSNELMTRYGGYEIVEPEGAPPSKKHVVATAAQRGL